MINKCSPTESSRDILASFAIEFVWTSILLLVIYLNFSTDSKYRKSLLTDKDNLYGYTYGPIITGVVLMALIYSSIAIGKSTGIFAGHMFPLITIPGMSSEGGLMSVSFIKGLVLLFAQFLSMFVIWYMVYKTEILN